MKILIVYDSFFGNTEKTALSIAEEIKEGNIVNLVKAGSIRAEDIKGIELLIAGSPTRAFRPTAAINRFLKSIPSGALKNVKAAAFDTRIPLSDVNSAPLKLLIKLFGYAAEPIAEKLEKKGAILAAPPEGFLVADSEGPLKEGEIQRAREWGKKLGNK